MGLQLNTVTLSANDAASDNAWDAMADRAVTVTNDDNEVAGFALGKTATTVSESGTADAFTVGLTVQPDFSVVLMFTSDDPAEAADRRGRADVYSGHLELAADDRGDGRKRLADRR